jgi:hypothetical protein
LYRAIAQYSLHQLHAKRLTTITLYFSARIKPFSTGSTLPFSGSGVFRRDPLEWLVGRHTNGTEQQHALRSY